MTRNDTIDAALKETRTTRDPERLKELYATAVREMNSERAYIWLFNTPFALIARPNVHGLNPARELGFGDFEPKPWVGGLWLADQ